MCSGSKLHTLLTYSLFIMRPTRDRRALSQTSWSAKKQSMLLCASWSTGLDKCHRGIYNTFHYCFNILRVPWVHRCASHEELKSCFADVIQGVVGYGSVHIQAWRCGISWLWRWARWTTNWFTVKKVYGYKRLWIARGPVVAPKLANYAITKKKILYPEPNHDHDPHGVCWWCRSVFAC